MQMKKALIAIFALILALGGLFLWKGGHHAIAISQILEEYLDTDDAVTSVTVQIQIPGAKVNPETGQLKPHIAQYQMTFDTFVTEYADRPLFCLTADGASAYTDGEILYMDTGKAYAIPEHTKIRKCAQRMTVGMLLKGRITKHGDTYEITMKHGGLELNAVLTADSPLQSAAATVVLPDDMAVIVSVIPATPAAHSVPRPVLDAMVRSKMEQPMELTKPLEVLLPALEDLLPLEGQLTLGVESGILKLSETVLLRMDGEKAELERTGVAVAIDLPMTPESVQPLGAALLLLRHGEFLLDGDDAQITLTLPPETTGAVCTALVPQIESLGMTFKESTATLTIRDGSVKTAVLNAGGEVPFLVATIPLSFTAELNIP